METSLETKKNKALATPTLDDSWGAEEVTGSDIRIHKILLMQGISTFVADEKARPGAFVDSITAEEFGSTKSPFEIVPIYMWKDFVIMEEIEGKFTFKERIPETTENTHWREFKNWNYEEDGVKMRRDFTMNFLVMLEKDLADEFAIPKVMSFSRFGLDCGKDIAEYFLKARQRRVPPCSFTLKLAGKTKENEKGKFFVPTLEGGRATTDFERVEPVLKNWFMSFKSGAAKMDESDIAREAQAEAGSAAPTKEYDGQF